MNFPWHKKIDKASLIETFNQMANLTEKYEKHEIGWKVLIPNDIHEKILEGARRVKKLKEASVYFNDMKNLYQALQVLNNKEVANNSDVAGKAYGQLLSTAGEVMSKLPFPASEYGGILKQIGEQFPKFVKTVMPSTHGGDSQANFDDFLKGGQKFINGI